MMSNLQQRHGRDQMRRQHRILAGPFRISFKQHRRLSHLHPQHQRVVVPGRVPVAVIRRRCQHLNLNRTPYRKIARVQVTNRNSQARSLAQRPNESRQVARSRT